MRFSRHAATDIGIATGADRPLFGKLDAFDVEDDRKEPLVTARDIISGTAQWPGYVVVNPFTVCGGPVDLGDFSGVLPR